ncbi:MAG: hypothetical protein HOP19_01245 [Acidobacteria bacterium]|nr:hypothetical protein [Acidobacteriota bacterium]
MRREILSVVFQTRCACGSTLDTEGTLTYGKPSIAQYPALSQTLGKYLEAALYGKLLAQEALDKAASEVNALLRTGGN